MRESIGRVCLQSQSTSRQKQHLLPTAEVKSYHVFDYGQIQWHKDKCLLFLLAAALIDIG